MVSGEYKDIANNLHTDSKAERAGTKIKDVPCERSLLTIPLSQQRCVGHSVPTLQVHISQLVPKSSDQYSRRAGEFVNMFRISQGAILCYNVVFINVLLLNGTESLNSSVGPSTWRWRGTCWRPQQLFDYQNP